MNALDLLLGARPARSCHGRRDRACSSRRAHRAVPPATCAAPAQSPPVARAGRRRARAPGGGGLDARRPRGRRGRVRRCWRADDDRVQPAAARRRAARPSTRRCPGRSAGRASRGTRGCSSLDGLARAAPPLLVVARQRPLRRSARMRPPRAAAPPALGRRSRPPSRSGSRTGAGHSTAIAISEAPRPSPSPRPGRGSRRRPGERDRQDEREQQRVVAPASTELTTPTKRTANATSAIAVAASQRSSARRACQGTRTRSPQATPAPPGPAGGRASARRSRRAAASRTTRRRRTSRRPVRRHLVAEREHPRHDDRRPPRPPQRPEIRVAPRKPVARPFELVPRHRLLRRHTRSLWAPADPGASVRGAASALPGESVKPPPGAERCRRAERDHRGELEARRRAPSAGATVPSAVAAAPPGSATR